MIVRYDTIR